MLSYSVVVEAEGDNILCYLVVEVEVDCHNVLLHLMEGVGFENLDILCY
jgi:hypothetical protein